MSKLLLTMAGALLLLVCNASAQAPSSEAMEAARKLVATLKIADQYRAALPQLMLKLRPVVAQDRPEIERDYEAMMPMIADAFTPYYTSMVDGVATVYANNFTATELREIEAFYRQPIGQKMLEKTPLISQQALAVGQEIGRKAAEDLRQRLTEALRQKGHKL